MALQLRSGTDTGYLVCELPHRMSNNSIHGWDREGNETRLKRFSIATSGATSNSLPLAGKPGFRLHPPDTAERGRPSNNRFAPSNFEGCQVPNRSRLRAQRFRRAMPP